MSIYVAMLALAAPAIAEPAAGSDPITCAPGIYAVAADGGLTALPQTKADHRKVTGMFGAALLGPIGGGKMKVKTVVPGMSAAIKLVTMRPAFQFCFAPPVATTGASSDYVGVSAGAGSPRDYQLVRFDQAKDQRELALAAVGGFGGPEGQISKSSVPFQTEQVSPGRYRITPSRDLEPGQYGFLYAVSAPASARKKDVREQVYDFAVTG